VTTTLGKPGNHTFWAKKPGNGTFWLQKTWKSAFSTKKKKIEKLTKKKT
jgi:hypothetical protein